MAIKDTNHRLSVTLTESEYAEVRALGEDLGGKSASKAAAHAVRGYVEAQNMVIDLRRALDLMAGDLVRMCYHKRDWLSVWDILMMGELAGSETRYSIERQLSESGTLMGGVYRAAYLEWCGREGMKAHL